MPETNNVKSTVATLVAGQILRTLEDNLVAKKICNLDAGAEIKQKGDTIVFPTLSDPTINTYTDSVTYEELDSNPVTLNIDQAKYYAFEVSDIDALQSSVELKSSQATRAGYMLSKTADQYVLGLHTEAGTTLPEVTITPENVLSEISNIQLKLAEQNVGENDMWIVIPVWVRQMLTLAGVKFQINNGTNGTGTMSFTNELGFNVMVSNNVPTETDGDTTTYKILAGSYNAIVYAEQLLNNEIIRLESKFADGARGLHVYGAKVVKPEELVCANFVKGSTQL